MRAIGLVLLMSGLLWVGIAFRMDTTVTAGGAMVGDTWIPTRTVHNIGLQDERRNHLLIGSLIAVIGALLFGFGGLQAARGRADDPTPVPVEPPCSRDLALDPYKVWLVARYGISRNEVLGAWVCEGQLFPDVDGALARAHQQELAAHAAREEAALAEAAARTGEKHKATAAAALRAEALQRWRPLIIAVALVVFGGGGYSAVRSHQADLARRAEIAQLQAHFTELGEKRDAISASREQAVAAREAAVSASATALESAELSKLEFRLAPDDLGLGYTATVKNGSSYHLESLTGSLHPLSDGADFGAESFFLCCDHATDQHGFDRGYAIAPGGKARKEQAVGIYDVQADAPERRKFASDHGLTLKEDFIGQPTMPIDALAHFDGSARWVREPRLEVSGEANVYTAEPVDFHALAEKEGDWRVMDADIAGLDAELGAIDTELEALRARLPSTSN